MYDNNTVDLRQQRFQNMLDGENPTEHFDMTRDDEIDDLRDGSIQTLSATMDDAEEQHERQISQISKSVSSEQISKKKELNYTAQEDILILQNVLYAPTKICYIKGLKQMKRRGRKIYNG